MLGVWGQILEDMVDVDVWCERERGVRVKGYGSDRARAAAAAIWRVAALFWLGRGEWEGDVDGLRTLVPFLSWLDGNRRL